MSAGLGVARVRAEASEALGMPKKTLYHKLRNLRIPARGDAAADGGE